MLYVTHRVPAGPMYPGDGSSSDLYGLSLEQLIEWFRENNSIFDAYAKTMVNEMKASSWKPFNNSKEANLDDAGVNGMFVGLFGCTDLDARDNIFAQLQCEHYFENGKRF